MKRKNLLLSLICLFGLCHLSAQVNLKTKIDFVADNLLIPQALDKLAKEQKINIAFSKQFFQKTKPVTLNYKNKELGFVLREILKRTNVDFKFQNNQLIVFRSKKLPKKSNQRYTLSGFVSEASSGERLVGVNVYDKISGKWATTNEYGFYSITIPATTNRLSFSYLGCAVHEVSLGSITEKRLDVNLKTANTLAEVIVRPDVDSAGLTSLISDGQLMPPNYVAIAPGIGGESDILNMLTTLPGVQTGADGFGGMYIRGGEASHNLMLLDGVPIYNPGHLLGVFSVYNTDAIRSAKLIKGSFPARYGGRISSVFDVRTKEGNQKKWTAEIGSGLISAKTKIEGPLFKKKGGFLFTARRTHAPLLLDNIFRTGIFQNSEEMLVDNPSDFSFSSDYDYNFFDINAKLHFPIGKKDKLFFSFYKGQDNYGKDSEFIYEITDPDFPDETGDLIEENESILKWGNQTTAIRWNRVWGTKLFSNITATYSKYEFQDSQFSRIDVSDFFSVAFTNFNDKRSKIRDYSVKADFDYSPNSNHRIRFGALLTHHELSPRSSSEEFQAPVVDGDTLDDIEDFVDRFDEVSIGSIEGAVYLEDEYKIREQLLLNAGLRYSFFNARYKFFSNAEPRIGLSYQPSPKWNFSGGLSKMVQYLHQIPSTGLSLPNDIWVPSSKNEKPQTSWVYELGLSRRLPKNMNVSIQAFYKKMNRILAPENPSINSNIEVNSDFTLEGVVSGSGTSKGLEFIIQKEGKTGGWISYTLSKTTRNFDDSDFNNGEPFAFRFDQRHTVNVFAYHQFNKKWHLSLNWKNNTPSPEIRLDETIGVISQLDPDFEPPTELPISLRTTQRGKIYHRLDVGINYTTTVRKTNHKFKIGAFNVYNRSNAAFYSILDHENFGVRKIPVTLLKFTPSLFYAIGF